MPRLNLLAGGIQHSNLFKHLPLFDDIYFEGTLSNKVRKFTAIREEQPCRIFSLTVIRKDEDVVWDGLEDLVKGSVATAASASHGVFTFELLTIDIHNEIRTFSPQELSQVILNHSLKSRPGEVRLIRYSSVYGLLQKLVHENWGKMVLKTAIEVFSDKPEFLDLLVKRLLKDFEFSNDPAILLINDLSLNPLFDASNSLQQERLKNVIEAQIPKSIEFPPEVYIQDRNGVRELLSGSVIK